MYTSVEVQWARRACSHSLVQRVAKVILTWILNTGTSNKRNLWLDLVKMVCKVKAFASGYNIIMAWLGWSLSYARLLIFLQVYK